MTHSSPRPTWDETRIEMARVIARRSLCVRDQVGAIIVDANQKVIGEGHNGPPKNFIHKSKPCTNWCKRAGEPKVTGMRSTNESHMPGEIIFENGKMYHEYAGQRKLITEGEEESFYLQYGFERVYEKPKEDYSDCPALHAEANALMMSDRSLRAGGLIYVTSHPCSGCAKLIANSGLMGVYVHADPEHEYRNDPAVYRFLTELGMLVRIIQ